jgi:lipoprotein NlpI
MSTRSLRRAGKALLAAAAAIALAAANAGAADQQDLITCQDSVDMPRMIAACTNLVQDSRLPPDARSMALLKRGFGNFALDHLDAAQADFTEAIRLNPKNNFAHHELGLTLSKKGDVPGAIASLTEAIRLDPTSAASRFTRGQTYLTGDRLDEAMADFTDAIKLGADKNTAFVKDQTMDRPPANHVTAEYYAARGYANYLKGNFKDAASDYDQAAEFPDPQGYGVIWQLVARIRGGSAAGDTALSAVLDKGQLKDWQKVIGELLVGRITPAAAMAAAQNADQTCEAHFYTAIAELKPDAALAEKEFAAARDGCPTSFLEHQAAVADLKRLQPR